MLAATKLGQVVLFLRLGATAINLVYAEIRMRAIAQSNRGRGAADLFNGNTLGEIAKACAAVGLRNGDAQQTHIPKFSPKVLGEAIGGINLLRAWCDLCLGKSMNGLALQVDICAKIKVQRRVVGDHRIGS